MPHGKLYVGHWSKCSIGLVNSKTSKLFGRIQILGNLVVKICMICKIYNSLRVTDSWSQAEKIDSP